MGEQFTIQVPYVALFNPNNFLIEVNDALKVLKEEGRANILFRTIRSLDRNVETGAWYIEGDLAPEDGDVEEDPEMQFNRMRDLDNHDCELNLPLLHVLLAAPLHDAQKNIVTHPRYIRLFQIPELIQKIKGWSQARGILDNGIWYTQATKMYEEDGEIAPGVAKSKRNMVIDGVGDMIVVMVNLLELTNFNSEAIAAMVASVRKEAPPMGNAHYLYHKLRMSNTLSVDYMWEVAGVDSPKQLTRAMFDETQIKYAIGHLGDCLIFANALANAYEFTLEQALSMAWDEIKDRTGFLNADGVFVKESDMSENDRIQRALKDTEQAGEFDGDNSPARKLEVDLSGEHATTTARGMTSAFTAVDELGTVEPPTKEISYFPVVPTTEQLSAATDAIHATLGVGSVQFVRVGTYYGGDTFYPRPHILFEFTLDGRPGTRHQQVEEGEYWEFADDAASYIVREPISD